MFLTSKQLSSVPALRLEPPPGGLNVGLVWASNPDNKEMYRNKSMPTLS